MLSGDNENNTTIAGYESGILSQYSKLFHINITNIE